MERSDLLKLLVLVIVGMFILSTFNYFGRDSSGNNQNDQNSFENTTPIVKEAGTAIAAGKVVGYSQEIVIVPWNSNLTASFNKLKAAGQVEYVNVGGQTARMFLTRNANMSVVRDEFLQFNVDVLGTAVVSINQLVNFTLTNGEPKSLFVQNIRLLIDPINPVGSELLLDLSGDISDTGVTNIQAEVRPISAEISLEGAMKCGEEYKLDGTILWEKRDINLTELGEQLNITNESIGYLRADIVAFSRPLNQTELDALKALGNPAILNLIPDGALVPSNLIDKAIAEALFAPVLNNGVTLKYPTSSISLLLDGNTTLELGKNKLSNLSFTNLIVQQGCTISVPQNVVVNGQTLIMDKSQRELSYFVTQADIKNPISFFGNASIAGKTIVDFSLRGFK